MRPHTSGPWRPMMDGPKPDRKPWDTRLIAAAPDLYEFAAAFVKAVEMFKGLSAKDVQAFATMASDILTRLDEPST